jgi:hypothetical protein
MDQSGGPVQSGQLDRILLYPHEGFPDVPQDAPGATPDFTLAQPQDGIVLERRFERDNDNVPYRPAL